MSDLNVNNALANAGASVTVQGSQTQAAELPVKQGDDFIGEFEVMNLDVLKDKVFGVSVSTGDRNKAKFLSTCLRGPYNFTEMVEEVGAMWRNEQHHAKVIVLEKDRTKPVKFLDENTTDYIEAHYVDIITEAMLDGIFDEKEYTCRAGLIEDSMEDDPIAAQRKEREEKADDLEPDTLP